MSNKTLDGIKNILLDLDAKISHIEDIEADNRTLIVKMIKQGNSIVKFLSKLELESTDVEYEWEDMGISQKDESKPERSERMKHIKELVDEFMDRQKDLEELEKELKKHNVKLTPEQIGEA